MPMPCLKLLFLPHGLPWPSGGDRITIKPEPEILGRLRAADVNGACVIAGRRLWAAGLVADPGPRPEECNGISALVLISPPCV